MASLSDLIEEHILSVLAERDCAVMSRSRLSSQFNCAPSQVTYVLSTRFTLERGFICESKRGGGGSITVRRAAENADYLDSLISDGIGTELTSGRAAHICERMLTEKVIDGKEYAIMSAVLSDKAFPHRAPQKDKIRAKILIAAVEALLKE